MVSFFKEQIDTRYSVSCKEKEVKILYDEFLVAKKIEKQPAKEAFQNNVELYFSKYKKSSKEEKKEFQILAQLVFQILF